MPLCCRILILLCGTLLLCAGMPVRLSAASGPHRVSGKVLEDGSGQPVAWAYVLAEQTGYWAVTDESGRFTLSLPEGQYVLRTEILGYEPARTRLEVRTDCPGIEIRLKVTSLMLEEVVVTAREGGGMQSSSRITSQVLQHIQPASLSDVMQLLPGGMTSNPNPTDIQYVSVRDLGVNPSNALGTAVWVDGAVVSNDANLQSGPGTASFSSMGNSGNGIDARQIPTDNIESLEVIRGIPSAAYGDLTSGAVIVRTRAGVTPWVWTLKADPLLKQASFGKGIALGRRGGVLNVDADYLHSVKDLRYVSSAYRRTSVQLGYSRNLSDVLTFHAKLKGYYGRSSMEDDPDLFLGNLQENVERNLALNVYGKWSLNLPWVSWVDYQASGSVSGQRTRERKYLAPGRIPGTESMQSGIGIGFFTPYEYYSDVAVYGLPVQAQGRLTAVQWGRYGKWTQKAQVGAEYRLTGNSGRGQVLDPQLPPMPGNSSTFRERPFRDIPYLHRISAFAEERLRYGLAGGNSLEIQAGLRVSALAARGMETEQRFSLEPRFNVRYDFARTGGFFRELALRTGWGIAAKAPPLFYLFPDNAYADLVSFAYNDYDANGYGLALLTTLRQDVRNPGLGWQQSRNWETGLDFAVREMSGSIAWFRENLTGGYMLQRRYVPLAYQRYGYVWGADGTPEPVLLPSGKQPVFYNGSVYVDGRPLPFITDTAFVSFNVPVQGVRNEKQGVELTVDFPEITPLQTRINLSAAYLSVRTVQETPVYWQSGRTVNGRTEPYVGIYAGRAATQNGSLQERLSANIRFITHLPRLAMVVTVTAQLVFLDRTTNLYEVDGVSQAYYYDGDRRVSGQDALQDRSHIKYINPLYVMDRKGNVRPFTEEMERDPAYRNLILSTNVPTYYLTSGYPFYGMLNLRLTKEIGSLASVSFYANNFLNIRGRVRNTVTGYPQDMNSPLYFGAELKFTLR